MISQLVGLLHDREPKDGDRKLSIGASQFQDGTVGVGVIGIDLRAIIRRWVRGFHAALYQEPMPTTTKFMTQPPLPEAKRKGSQIEWAEIPEVVPKFVAEIKRNRVTGSLDSIQCRNGRCRYECVWSQADDEQWICIYALDLYGWKQLGDVTHFRPRGCIGAYQTRDHNLPKLATRGTRLEFTIGNREHLDAFGD